MQRQQDDRRADAQSRASSCDSRCDDQRRCPDAVVAQEVFLVQPEATEAEAFGMLNQGKAFGIRLRLGATKAADQPELHMPQR
jgi:hypothetical protein